MRFPKQHLATFGTTNIAYYVVTEPIYQEPDDKNQEGVVRTGRVIAERPSVITPTYAMNLEGFRPEAYEYLEYLAETYGSNSSGILYRYKNEAEKTDIVGGTTSEIAGRISEDLDRRNENMSIVMVGVDEFWDLALLPRTCRNLRPGDCWSLKPIWEACPGLPFSKSSGTSGT